LPSAISGRAVDQALAEDPGSVLLRFFKIVILVREGRRPAALAEHREMQRFGPGFPLTLRAGELIELLR
jgi:hypothetical protein